MQTEVRRRFSDGLYFQANYTYSRAMTDFEGSQSNFAGLMDLGFGTDIEKQRSTNDVTHGTTLREARRQLRLLVEGLARVAPNARVIVSGLPPAETSVAFHRPLRDLLGLRALLFTRLYRAELTPHGISVFDIANPNRRIVKLVQLVLKPWR